MPDRTITRRIARYRKKLKSDRGWKRVEVLVPASHAEALKQYAASLRALGGEPLGAGSPATEALAPFFEEMARRYFWWKAPEELSSSPQRVALQVMDVGTFEDAQRLVRLAGETFLRDALGAAEQGQLNPRSWAYWNYRLGVARPGMLPSPPARSFA